MKYGILRVYRFNKKGKLGYIFLATTKDHFHLDIECRCLLLVVWSIYFKYRLFLQMVMPTKTASCYRYWKHYERCSRWIRWYWVCKITKIFITTELENSTENITLWTSSSVCVSRNRRCMAKKSTRTNWGN